MNGPGRNLAAYGVLALVLLAITQLVFWGMVTLAERQARPADLSARAFVGFQVLDDSGEPVSGGQTFRAAYQGTSGYRADTGVEGETDLYSIAFEVEDPEQQLALFMAIREYLKEVKVNGITVQPEVPLQELRGAVTSEPAYFPLPMSVLRRGTNVLTIAKEHEGMVSALPEFTIGPALELADAYRWKNRYLVDIPLAGVAILGFTLALCLVVNWPAQDRARMRWLMAFLAACMGFTASMTFLPQPSSLAVNGALIIAFQLAIGTTMGKYVAHDIAAARWVHRLVAGASGLAALATGAIFAASLVDDAWFEALFPTAVYSSMSFVVAMCVACVLALCWVCAARSGERLLERLVVAICLTTFAVDRQSSFQDIYSPFDQTLPISLYWSPIVGGLLGLGLILALARQAAEARRTVLQSNEILARRLKEQDAELARSYDAQKTLLQRQVMLEERQRIVRDMHDGIGGQLLGLMMQVKRGWADPVAVEQGLQSSLADLRLIVDSMDTAEAGLAESLRAFEHRARPMVEAAGLQFHFASSLAEDEAGLGPRPTLQVLRVMQEAVTNAIRHSGASNIQITGNRAKGGAITIMIRDDGRGIPDPVSGGRGLANMRHRMAAIGGAFHLASGEGGTTITLTLPRAD